MLSPSKPACNLVVLLPRPVTTIVRSSLCFFLPLSSLSRVWVANVRPAVVLFYDLALLMLPLIPLCFMPDDGTPSLTSFISHSLHTPQSPDLISCLRFPIITIPSLCVRPLVSLALALIVCAYYFPPLDSFRCVYFLSNLSSSLFIFPLTVVLP